MSDKFNERPKVRKSWGEMNPQTRVAKNHKAFDRNKRHNWKNEVKNHFSYGY